MLAWSLILGTKKSVLVVRLLSCVSLGPSSVGRAASPSLHVTSEGGCEPLTWHSTSYSTSAVTGLGRFEMVRSRMGSSSWMRMDELKNAVKCGLES